MARGIEKALRSNYVGEEKVAERVQAKYCPTYSPAPSDDAISDRKSNVVKLEKEATKDDHLLAQREKVEEEVREVGAVGTGEKHSEKVKVVGESAMSSSQLSVQEICLKPEQAKGRVKLKEKVTHGNEKEALCIQRENILGHKREKKDRAQASNKGEKQESLKGAVMQDSDDETSNSSPESEEYLTALSEDEQNTAPNQPKTFTHLQPKYEKGEVKLKKGKITSIPGKDAIQSDKVIKMKYEESKGVYAEATAEHAPQVSEDVKEEVELLAGETKYSGDDDESDVGGRDQGEHDIQPKKRSRRRHRESSMSHTARGSSSPSTSLEENQRQPESKGKIKPKGKGKTHKKKKKNVKNKEGLSSSTETDNSSPECDMLKNISETESKGLRKVFKRFFGRLCFTIKAPVELATRLQMKGLLTYSVMNELLTSPESEQAKTISLVRTLQKQVKSRPDRMFSIIQVFLHDEALQQTGREIWTETGNNVCKWCY